MTSDKSEKKLSRRELLGVAGTAAVTGLMLGHGVGLAKQGSGSVIDSVYGNSPDNHLEGKGNAVGIRRIAEEVVQEHLLGIEAQLGQMSTNPTMYFMQNPEQLTVGDIVITTGFYAAGDGGAGMYTVQSVQGNENWYNFNGYFLSHQGELKTGDNKLVYLPSNVINVKSLGALGDGNENDTVVIQAVINSVVSEATVFFPDGIYLVHSLNINQSIRFYSKNRSTIKFKDSLGVRSSMFNVMTNGIDVHFENIIFDGNKNNQIAPDQVNRLYYRIINWIARDHAFVNDRSTLSVDRCSFLNTPTNAVFLIGYDTQDKADVEHSVFFRIEDSYFEKGYENAPGHLDTNVISISGNCNGLIAQNSFIKNEPITQYGLGAITISTANVSAEVFSSVVISNNYFKNYGRQTTSGVGPIGVIDFYASCDEILIDGNRFVDSYYAAIKGKTNSRNCIVTNNIIDGVILNSRSNVKSFGISIGRGTYFDIYDKYIVSHNIVKNIYGNGIEVIGSNSGFQPSPVGKIKDISIIGNVVDVIPEKGTASYGVLVQHYENAIVSQNILRNNDRAIYCNDCKVGAVITANEMYDTKNVFIIFQGHNSGETGYEEYDADLLITNNLMRTTVESGFTGFMCQYYERVSNVVSIGNIVRIKGTTPASHFLRTGSQIQGSVSSHQNLVQGAVTHYFGMGSGTLFQSQNLHNGNHVI